MTTAHALIKIVSAEVGTHEGRSSGHWDNIQKYSEELPGFRWSDGQPWCDTFCGWGAWKAGLTEAEFPRSASVLTSMAAWKGMHRWSEYPAIGAQVCFGNGVHTGIVKRFTATTITTIEGNTNDNGSPEGDGVYEHTHQRRDPWVVGYGYPIFDHPIHSADPAWATDPAHPPKVRHHRLSADSSFAHPDPKALVRAGFRGIHRYVSHDPKKNLTVREAKAYGAAGLWVDLIFEDTAGRATQGEAAGLADVAFAEHYADQLGYPTDALIWYAVDSDVTAAQVEPYMAGVHSAAKRPVGIYGGFKVVDAAMARHGWQTEAWSNGQVSKHADMLQIIGHVKVPGTDTNELQRPRRWHVWHPAA